MSVTTLSVFDLFKIGIGPSSSHTVGPMKAAKLFVEKLQSGGHLTNTSRVTCELYGSLGATGKGHGSDKAVILGLMGHAPDTVEIDKVPSFLEAVQSSKALRLLDTQRIDFDPKTSILFFRRSLDQHPNGLKFTSYSTTGETLASATYFSIGGGFLIDATPSDKPLSTPLSADNGSKNVNFESGAELLALTHKLGCSISSIMRTHERKWRGDAEIDRELLNIWAVMQACVERGCHSEGVLPGGFQVRRRAPDLYRQLSAQEPAGTIEDPLKILDWVNLYALAVNEENAAGRGVVDFFLTAGAIGFLYKKNASISGAEVGCQGEVGVACSMAAGALCEVLGGSPDQVENAAEIGMEHHLGLTCDPVGGLVQIPCIERNAIASVKAINAARMALRGDGKHSVSLDKVIKTMFETGADMNLKYKETARGGLAVNIVEC
jgi:L-serine dehydratase